jgi:hypothetical protein
MGGRMEGSNWGQQGTTLYTVGMSYVSKNEARALGSSWRLQSTDGLHSQDECRCWQRFCQGPAQPQLCRDVIQPGRTLWKTGLWPGKRRWQTPPFLPHGLGEEIK